MTQREIDHAAAIIRATPIEPPPRHIDADDFDPAPSWGEIGLWFGVWFATCFFFLWLGTH